MNENSSSRSGSSFDHFSSHYEEYVEDPLKSWIGGNSSEYYLRLKAEEISLHLHRLGVDASKLVALDVGCGTGAAAGMVHSRFAAFYGVDSSRGMIERARQRSLPGVSFQTSDGEALPFEKNFFDFIYSMSLFHHVSPAHRSRTLREMVRVLKPGGWIFTFEHNARNPLTQWIVSRCPLDAGVELLHAGEMTALYRQAKLDAIHTRFMLFFPKQLKLFQRCESYLSWLPLGGQFYVCGSKLD
jgi:ubiquinone/menaquinone biosynthesis C-methylase UbiE